MAGSPQQHHQMGATSRISPSLLEEIAESGEEECAENGAAASNFSSAEPRVYACNAVQDFLCRRGGEPIYDADLTECIRLICSNGACPYSPYMHMDCFEMWQDNIVLYLKNSNRASNDLARSMTDKPKLQNLWTKRGYDLVYKFCPCNCQQGHLRKDLTFVPPPPHSIGDQDKHKLRRKRKNSKNGKSAFTIGLPTLSMGNVQSMKRSDAQGIPSLNRNRTNSVSSTASGSSSFSSSLSSPANSPPSDSNIPPRRSLLMDRIRHDSGGSIFLRRTDFSSFNVLPKHKINSYHIKMEDECSIGNDETRCFILSNYATNKMNRVPCVLCSSLMNIFERYPLIDGTFFLSPRQHTKACIPVKLDGRSGYLSAVCMGCLEGWNTSILCRFCLQPWDGSHLILGTMYSYDIFAAVPCCPDRLKCTNCSQLVIHPEQRFNFFSDYSQTVSCPHCGVQDFHFTKPLGSYVSREELSKAASNQHLQQQLRMQPQFQQQQMHHPQQQIQNRSWAAAVRS